jgi:predicted signal transduction protein with EAL and GGDEF domain
MTALDARVQIQRLGLEHLDALEAGLGANRAYMDDLDDEIAAARENYVGLAVTEIASLRAALDGPLFG